MNKKILVRITAFVRCRLDHCHVAPDSCPDETASQCETTSRQFHMLVIISRSPGKGETLAANFR